MKTEAFNANLSDTMAETDVYLPLTTRDTARLVSLLGTDGEFTFLTVTDGLYAEYVKAVLTAGTVVLTRGVDSTARKFPKGSCVLFENSVPVTKWLICNYECCDGDCPVEAVKARGYVAPEGTPGKAWQGSAVFSGGLPMQFGVSGMPSWMSADVEGNAVMLSGTPTAAGSYTVAVAASNDRGGNMAVQTVPVTITAS